MNTERRKRKPFRTIFTIGLGILVATLVAEVLLRIVEISPLWKVLPVGEVAIYSSDSQSGYRIRPNVEGVWLNENRTKIITSPQGLRDFDTPYSKSPESIRLVVAGDSITEALQVAGESVFTELMEKDFQQHYGNVDVVNLGMSGAIPTVQMARMQSLGVQFEPDMMLFVINIFDFASTTLREDSAFPGYKKTAEGTWQLSYGFRNGMGYRFRESTIGQGYYWLLDNSRVARLINARRNRGLELPGSGGVQSHQDDSGCNDNSLNRFSTALLESNVAADEVAVFQAFIRDLKATSKAAKADPVLVVRGLLPECVKDHERLLSFSTKLAALLKSEGIQYIDMDRAIKDVLNRTSHRDSQVKDLYGFGVRIGEGHLNYFGHAVFSQALSEKLIPLIDEHR